MQDLNFYLHEGYKDFFKITFYLITIGCETTAAKVIGWCPHSYPLWVERGFGQTNCLGMALSREILTITNITIIESGQPGEGARFEIRVPKDMWHRVKNKVRCPTTEQ